MERTDVSVSREDVFEAIDQIFSKKKHQQGIEGLFNYAIKIKNLEDVSLDFLKAEIIKLEKDGRVVYKKFNGIDSFYRC